MSVNNELGRPDRMKWRWVQSTTNVNLDLAFVDAAQAQRFLELFQTFAILEKAEGTENMESVAHQFVKDIDKKEEEEEEEPYDRDGYGSGSDGS